MNEGETLSEDERYQGLEDIEIDKNSSDNDFSAKQKDVSASPSNSNGFDDELQSENQGHIDETIDLFGEYDSDEESPAKQSDEDAYQKEIKTLDTFIHDIDYPLPNNDQVSL